MVDWTFLQLVEHNSEIMGLRLSLEKECQKREHLEQELRAVKSEASRKSLNGNLQKQSDELLTMRQRLEDELKERERLEEEIRSLKEHIVLLSDEGDEVLWYWGDSSRV
jgi:kinesin family protein 5